VGKFVERSPHWPARLVALLALPFAAVLLFATAEKAAHSYRMAQQAEQVRLEVETLKQRNLELQREIVASRSDAAIEAVARQELGLVRPGDKAVVIVAPSPAPAPSPTPLPPPTPRPAWEQWGAYFFE